MKTELVALDSVKTLDKNPRRHPELQLQELVKSIEQFGQYRPLVVDEEGTILIGNGLYEALKRVGMSKVSVYRKTGLSPSQKSKLILADNRIGDLSNDDFDVVEAMVRELEDYEVPGYDPDVLRGIIADASDVLEQAGEYGVLSDEELAQLREEEEGLSEANAAATIGSAPSPAPELEEPADLSVDFSTGTPIGDSLADAVETRKREGHVCPACGRGW